MLSGDFSPLAISSLLVITNSPLLSNGKPQHCRPLRPFFDFPWYVRLSSIAKTTISPLLLNSANALELAIALGRVLHLPRLALTAWSSLARYSSGLIFSRFMIDCLHQLENG